MRAKSFGGYENKSHIGSAPFFELAAVKLIQESIRSGGLMNFNFSKKNESDFSFQNCLERGLNLLDGRAHSKAELERKLKQRHFPESVVTQAISELERLGLLNDFEFACLFIRDKLMPGSRPLGWLRLVNELGRRGISQESVRLAWNSVMEEGDIESENERALRAAEKKLASIRDRNNPRKVRSSLLRHLSSRGFTSEVAVESVNRVLAWDDEF